MPVPTAITDLSQTAASNFPAGSNAPSVLDDVQRTHASFIAMLRDGKGHSNAVTPLACSSTVDIGGQNALMVEVSGSIGPVTSFGANYNGPRIVMFTGAPTLTHNATSLILPGGVNITVGAGDCLIAVPKATAGTADGWRVVAFQRGTGQTAVNTGQLAGLRNVVINGNGLVQQRAAPTLTAALQYGAADRHLVGVTGGASVSGTVGVLANTGFSCGVGYGAIAASWTTGQFIHKHRIEGQNTKQFNSKTVTVSGKLYQDTGGSRSFTVSIGKPTTTLDTFSAVTNLGTSSAIVVPTGTVTAFSYTLALGSTDANLGLETLITDNAANTVSSKNYLVSDLQVEIGAVATVFEQRPFGLERALCERYFFSETPASAFASGQCNSSTVVTSHYKYPIPSAMRATPTISTSGTVGTVIVQTAGNSANPSAVSAPTVGVNSCLLNWSIAGATAGWGVTLLGGGSWTISGDAEL